MSPQDIIDPFKKITYLILNTNFLTCHFRTIVSPLIVLVFFSVMFVCLPSHLGILIMNFCLCLVEFSES